MPPRTARKTRKPNVIYDVLYGFVPITEWEAQIINSPFYQRLRWIRQLGFANYIFPGAEHNRFAHAVGVMHSMDQMLRALGLAVPPEELFDPKARSPEAVLHKQLRISALLHDVGTFPFSHAIEHAYIRHGNDLRAERRLRKGGARGGARTRKSPKALPNNHEHLGSYIVKNTPQAGGITRTLEDFGFDIQALSNIIKGESPIQIANQLMHSDLDADRMDYLLRDSHYTGIKYGQFDREYILGNLMLFDAPGGQQGFGIAESAAFAVEHFLFARFSWYSQVIKNPGSAKFDILSSHVAEAFLEEDLFPQFHDLLEMINRKDERFYAWNDVMFMSRCQELLAAGTLRDATLREQVEMLVYRRPPKTVRHPLFEHRILDLNAGEGPKNKLVREIRALVAEFEDVIEKRGTGREWILVDVPERDVVFTKSEAQLRAGRPRGSLLNERDPVKIVGRDGHPRLLVELENSLMKRIAGLVHFVPNVYANDAAVRLLRSARLIPSA